jgi:hypothetical protein
VTPSRKRSAYIPRAASTTAKSTIASRNGVLPDDPGHDVVAGWTRMAGAQVTVSCAPLGRKLPQPPIYHRFWPWRRRAALEQWIDINQERRPSGIIAGIRREKLKITSGHSRNTTRRSATFEHSHWPAFRTNRKTRTERGQCAAGRALSSWCLASDWRECLTQRLVVDRLAVQPVAAVAATQDPTTVRVVAKALAHLTSDFCGGSSTTTRGPRTPSSRHVSG